MARHQDTLAKRERERKKRGKAMEKRAKRQKKKELPAEAAPSDGGDPATEARDAATGPPPQGHPAANNPG